MMTFIAGMLAGAVLLVVGVLLYIGSWFKKSLKETFRDLGPWW